MKKIIFTLKIEEETGMEEKRVEMHGIDKK